MTDSSQQSPDNNKPLKLLLVDDDMLALEELGEIVELEDWLHVSASNIEDALAILEADEEITVVVTDVHFLDHTGRTANGIQFVSRAQAFFPDRPLSYLVLSGDPDAFKASVQVGAFSFVTKPFEAEELIDAVKRAVLSGGGERPDFAEVHSLITETERLEVSK